MALCRNKKRVALPLNEGLWNDVKDSARREGISCTQKLESIIFSTLIDNRD